MRYEMHFWIYLSNHKSYGQGSLMYDPRQNYVLPDFEGWIKNPDFLATLTNQKSILSGLQWGSKNRKHHLSKISRYIAVLSKS